MWGKVDYGDVGCYSARVEICYTGVLIGAKSKFAACVVPFMDENRGKTTISLNFELK